MDNATYLEIQQWVLKAKNDVKSACLLLENDTPIRDTGVYHCQQAVEKILKAYLAYCEVSIMKTHDLTVLLEVCCKFDASFEKFSDAADILTPYATAFRYPGDVLEPSTGDAQEALDLARVILKFVEHKLTRNEK